jgi:hypothetical protein
MEQLERLAWADYSSEFVGRVRPADVSSKNGDRLVVIDTNLRPTYTIFNLGNFGNKESSEGGTNIKKIYWVGYTREEEDDDCISKSSSIYKNQ